MPSCTVIGIMNQPTISRANASLGFILFILVAAALVFPRVVDATTSPNASQVPENPVELGGVSVPDEQGGTLTCSNPSGFGETSRLWECGDVNVLGSSEPTPEDSETALARFYRSVSRDRHADNNGVESPRDGMFVKGSATGSEDPLVAVSVTDGDTTQFFAFAGARAHEFSQRLIHAAPANPENKEESK